MLDLDINVRGQTPEQIARALIALAQIVTGQPTGYVHLTQSAIDQNTIGNGEVAGNAWNARYKFKNENNHIH